MRLDQRSLWILWLGHRARTEDITELAALLLTLLVRLVPVIHARQARHVLHVGHEARADDVVLILEEEGHIPVVALPDVLRQACIYDHIGPPAVLLRDVLAGRRGPVLGTLRPDNNRPEEPVPRIRHDIGAIPHQRGGLLVE